MNLKIKVYRGDSKTKETPRYETFEVPYKKGMTVLDVVQHIQTEKDPTFAYRFECRQGICGTCGVMLNNKPVLSCSTQIDPSIGEQVIEPLANFPVEKDLIVNLKPILDRYEKVKPFIEKIHKVTISRAVSNKSKPFRKCIECGCCIAGSETVSKHSESLDPMDLVKIARYLTDPRDATDRTDIIKKSGVEKYDAQEGKKLTDICPRGVPIAGAIEIVKQQLKK